MASKTIHFYGIKIASRRIIPGKALSRIPLMPSSIRLPKIAKMSAQDYSDIADRKRKDGNDEAALKNYKKALSLDPGHGTANYGLGSMHYLKKEFYKAAKCFEKAAAANPENTKAANLARQCRDEHSVQQAAGIW